MHTYRTRLAAAAIAVALACAACGSSGSGGSAEGPGGPAGPPAGTGDDFVIRSSLLPEDLVLSADEVQASLDAIEQERRAANPDGWDDDMACWMIVDDDGIAAQAVRCGPSTDADGVRSWASLPVSGARDDDGRVTLRYAQQLVGQIRPAMTGKELVRPDGREAPEEALSDVANIEDRPVKPEPAAACQAAGTVTDSVNGTFRLDGADLSEVETSVADAPDAADGRTAYRHNHRVLSWNDAAGRGVLLNVSVQGPPGDEALTSVGVDLDITSRPIMEAGQASNGITTVQADEIAGDYDAAEGGSLSFSYTAEPSFSLDPDIEVDVDVTVTCTGG